MNKKRKQWLLVVVVVILLGILTDNIPLTSYNPLGDTNVSCSVDLDCPNSLHPDGLTGNVICNSNGMCEFVSSKPSCPTGYTYNPIYYECQPDMPPYAHCPNYASCEYGAEDCNPLGTLDDMGCPISCPCKTLEDSIPWMWVVIGLLVLIIIILGLSLMR